MTGSLAAKVLRIAATPCAVHITVTTLTTSNSARDLTIDGHYAFVADGTAGLLILDLTDPSDPVEVGSVATSSNALRVAIDGRWAYVADGAGGVCIVDVSDPEFPASVGSHSIGAVADGVAEAGRSVVVRCRGVVPGAVAVVDQRAAAGADGQGGR